MRLLMQTMQNHADLFYLKYIIIITIHFCSIFDWTFGIFLVDDRQTPSLPPKNARFQKSIFWTFQMILSKKKIFFFLYNFFFLDLENFSKKKNRFFCY